MIALQKAETAQVIPPEVAQNYITEMLQELKTIAGQSGLRDLESILALTVTAARAEMGLETEA